MGESKGNISGVVNRSAPLQIRKMPAVFICVCLLLLICAGTSRAEQSSKNESKLIILARHKFGTLTPAEEKLFENISIGKLADYSVKDAKDNDPSEADKWDPNRVLDHNDIEWLCKDKQAADLLTHSGIWIRGARIDGNLNLAFVKTSIPLRFEKCKFNGNIDMEQASLYALDFSGTHTYSIDANRVTVEGDARFCDNFTAEGTVNLIGAKIKGYLNCAGGEFINNTNRGSDHENKAIEATGVKVDGNVNFCDGFKSKGTVSLYGAIIGRELDCKKGKFTNPGWVAFNGDQMQVNGCVFLGDGFEAEGQVRLIGATIGRDFDCTNGKFYIKKKDTAISKGYDEALKVPGLQVSGNVYMREGFKSTGMVRLAGATINGLFDCTAGLFLNKTNKATDPNLILAMEATGLEVRGSAWLRGDPHDNNKRFRAEGVVSLYGAKIGGDLDCKRGDFINPEGTALCAEMLEVEQHVFLSENFHAEGELRLESSKINGYLWLKNIVSPEKADLNLQFATIGMLNIKDIDKAKWPRRVLLHGLNYEGIDDKFADNDKILIAWLRRQYVEPDKPDVPSGYFRPQPYEQLAKVLNNSGRDKVARKILIAKNDDKKDPNLRIPLKWYQRSWHNFLGILIGYGYNPWRASWIGLVIVLIGWFLFWTGSDSCAGVITPINRFAYLTDKKREDGKIAEDYPKFNAFVYSLDVFIPLVDLHQTRYWLPNVDKKEKLSIFKKVHLPLGSRFLRCFFWFQILVGWILTLLLVAGLTGLVRK